MNEESVSIPEEGSARQRPSGAAPSYAKSDEISLLDLAAMLLRQRWTILGYSVLLAVLAVTFGGLQLRTWTADASFMPQATTDGSRARLSALAGQFGVDLGGEQAGQTPEFYADLLRSRTLLGAMASDSFVVMDTTGFFASGEELRGPLADLLSVEGDNAGVRRDEVIDWLKEEAVSVSTDRETGVVGLAVQTPWPELSHQIAMGLVDLVNQFNLETRQSQAAAERRFSEERMENAQADLRAVEDRLQEFLQNNRQFENSPELAFHYDRLQRQLAMRQQVYTSLVQSYEQARISEVRNTPVISVIEPAERPVRPDSRRLATKAVLGLVLGSMFGIFVGLCREYLRRQKGATGEYREVERLWEEMKSEIRATVGRAVGTITKTFP